MFELLQREFFFSRPVMLFRYLEGRKITVLYFSQKKKKKKTQKQNKQFKVWGYYCLILRKLLATNVVMIQPGALIIIKKKKWSVSPYVFIYFQMTSDSFLFYRLSRHVNYSCQILMLKK